MVPGFVGPTSHSHLGLFLRARRSHGVAILVLALVVGLVISANLCCIGCLCVVCGLSPHLMARSRGFRSAGSQDDEGVALRPQGQAPPSADEEAVE